MEFQKLFETQAYTADDLRSCGILYQYMMNNAKKQAINYFDKVLSQNKKDDMYYRTWRQKISLYAGIGKSEECITIHFEALEKDYDNPEQWSLLIAALEKKFPKKPDILMKVVIKMLSDEILDYIEENLKESLTLVDLSRRFYYSPRQLYYYLHEITGMPVMTYIRQRKLVNAAQEIALGRRMYDVATDYGFETQAGFYKAFLQCIGCTPSEFQNHHELRQLKQIDKKILSIREELDEMNEVKIRKMTLNDTKSLWENIDSGNTPEEVKERVQKNIAEMDSGNCVALVAAIGENIIGTALIKKSQHILSSNRCELYDVVVNPAFQKQGIGIKLCHECFFHAKQIGCDYVLTSCRNNGTERFNQALGMTECGRIPGGILEPWGDKKVYDEVIFYKRL